jgi:thioredoxin 1
MRREIKDSEFKELVLEKKNLVVVQFHAPWCNPCKFVTPQLEALALTHEDDIDVVSINIDEEQKIAAEYGIRNLPTVMFFKSGEMVERVIGASTEYDAFIEKLKH